jgi:hypothetical protein
MGERARRTSTSSITLDYGTHLSLFVVFDKKAGWIRLADSAVGELELYDGGNGHLLRHGDSIKSRSRISVEGIHSQHHHHVVAKWIPPIHCELPLPDEPGVTSKVYLLTWGRQTHIVPAPFRCSSPPLYALLWHSAPISISARICQPNLDDQNTSPFLQVIAFGGENGLEVQEISLSFLGKGKRKANLEEPVRRAERDFGGGDIGFLCSGGHWDASDHKFRLPPQVLARSYSTSSGMSFDSVESTDLIEQLKREEGIYGWYRKDAEDWRVFWVGGSSDDDSDSS